MRCSICDLRCAVCSRIDRRSHTADRTSLAFSLVEIMVVLVIIALLAGIVTINVRGYLITGKQSVAKSEIATICQALDTYYSLNDRYPSNDEGIEALTKAAANMPEPPLSKLPKDPWGQPYTYLNPGRDTPYEVISFGADGREGGEGPGKDISSADLEEDQQA